jgi:energy-coupling factor transporter ATP-binding protein EcfA2
MYIRSFTLRNYKCFFHHSPVELSRGMNVIVGRNNCGKSALLEALSLKATDKRHRSLLSAPRAADISLEPSQIDCTIATSGAEIASFLPDQFAVPLLEGTSGSDEERGRHALRQLLSSTTASMACRYGYVTAPLSAATTGNDTRGIGGNAAIFTRLPDGALRFDGTRVSDGSRLEYYLIHRFPQAAYSFRAERMNIGVSPFGQATELRADAGNLPEAINSLQWSPSRQARFNELVSRVLPSIHWVAARPNRSAPNSLELMVWDIAPDTRREDLAVPLAESGTGISQVLAMLYVLTTADTEKVIGIDEPNSFLHPGAVRVLMEIFREHPQHQYLVATHSPQTVAAAGTDAQIYQVSKDDRGVSTVSRIDTREASAARQLLREVGARLSDVFGADRVLWVEGATEEQCFRPIAERVAGVPLGSTLLLGVLHTSDFHRKTVPLALDVYRRLSGGTALVPPAVGFIFDRETRRPEEIEEIERQSNRLVTFLPMRMFENYLLNPRAIGHVLRRADPSVQATDERIEVRLKELLSTRSYYPNASLEFGDADAAAVLRDLFAELSEGRVEYGKVVHGLQLTEWLVQNDAATLMPLAELLRAKLAT